MDALIIMHNLPPTTEVPRHLLAPIIRVLKQNLRDQKIADDISDDELMSIFLSFDHPMDSSVELALGSFLLKHVQPRMRFGETQVVIHQNGSFWRPCPF